MKGNPGKGGMSVGGRGPKFLMKLGSAGPGNGGKFSIDMRLPRREGPLFHM